MDSSLKEKAYQYIFNAIRSCEFMPGMPLSEVELSEAIGVSRTPIREALKQLEAEGLVKHYSARGTFVTNLTTQDIEEIFALRECLEILALRTAIFRISDDRILRVESMLRSITDETDRSRFYESDRELHDMLIIGSGNKRLSDYMKVLNAQVERIRYLRPSRLKKSRIEHIGIIEAIKARNLPLAEAELTTHIRNIKASVIEVCQDIQFHETIDKISAGK